jgi:UDP-N-acetylglucosamine 2-epimerase (non-hydrolysing)
MLLQPNLRTEISVNCPVVTRRMKILSVVGARPNFMKIAPFIAAIRSHNARNTGESESISHVLVHTGQHYDKVMSDSFFCNLRLPDPDMFMGVGSASHAVQTAEIMRGFEKIVENERPDIVVVVGDVNSTVACALVASKITYGINGGKPLIAHIEAGLRSFDRTMPEEINRVVTDHLSDLLFVTEESGILNLRNEGIARKKVFLVGNTMIDTLRAYQKEARKSKILDLLGLNGSSPKSYALLTLHRPSNVDNEDSFTNIVRALETVSRQMPVIFPCHPRTRAKVLDFGLEHCFNVVEKVDFSGEPSVGGDTEPVEIKNSINLLPPLGYLDFLRLMTDARVVLTDSGGIQEETTCLGVPCVTIRENSERPVTLTQGTNILAGTKEEGIVKAVERQLGRRTKGTIPKYWDGKAAVRIVRILAKIGSRFLPAG